MKVLTGPALALRPKVTGLVTLPRSTRCTLRLEAQRHALASEGLPALRAAGQAFDRGGAVFSEVQVGTAIQTKSCPQGSQGGLTGALPLAGDPGDAVGEARLGRAALRLQRRRFAARASCVFDGGPPDRRRRRSAAALVRYSRLSPASRRGASSRSFRVSRSFRSSRSSRSSRSVAGSRVRCPITRIRRKGPRSLATASPKECNERGAPREPQTSTPTLHAHPTPTSASIPHPSSAARNPRTPAACMSGRSAAPAIDAVPVPLPRPGPASRA